MESAETDYSGYKECGHRAGDNYADASAAHAAISTTDLADPFANIPNADDSLNGEFSPAKTTPSQPRRTDIIERTGEAEYYLREARRAGLPLPAYVTVSSHRHGSHIGIQLTSTDDVGLWALHFGVQPVISGGGVSAELGATANHEVSAYHMFPEGKRSEHTQAAPSLADALKQSLAEHTQAAPVKYGDKVTGPRGSGTVVSTAQFNNASTVRYDEPRAFVIEQNTSLKLAEATQAACDTITKAAK